MSSNSIRIVMMFLIPFFKARQPSYRKLVEVLVQEKVSKTQRFAVPSTADKRPCITRQTRSGVRTSTAKCRRAE